MPMHLESARSAESNEAHVCMLGQAGSPRHKSQRCWKHRQLVEVYAGMTQVTTCECCEILCLGDMHANTHVLHPNISSLIYVACV